jgi:hypothetical protein
VSEPQEKREDLIMVKGESSMELMLLSPVLVGL